MRAVLSTILAAGFLFVGTPNLQAETTVNDNRVDISGRVIDLSCKVVHDLEGEDHRMCSQMCADQGVPLAILGDDGQIYLPVSMQMPSSGIELNNMLKPHAEHKVNITGTVVERAGVKGIIIEEITMN